VDRDLLSYIPAVLVVSVALYIFYLRHMKKKEQVGVGEVLIPVPEGTSTVEALLAVQQAVSQAENTIQGTNIALLKIRALLLSNYPEVLFLSFYIFIFYSLKVYFIFLLLFSWFLKVSISHVLW